MTKITKEKFMQMLKEDKEMAKKFAAYLGNTSSEKEIALKAAEFAKKEGYEFDVSKQKLTSEDLEAASGGRGGWLDLARDIFDWLNQDNPGGNPGGGQRGGQGGTQDPGYYWDDEQGVYYLNDGSGYAYPGDQNWTMF